MNKCFTKRSFNRLLPNNKFARDVSILAGGTAGGQAILILASPLLTRLYNPADFGLLAVFSAFLVFFTVIAAARYELAIVLPEKDQDAANIVVLCILCIIMTALIGLTVVLLWSSEIAAMLNAPELADYLWLIPVGVIFIGTYHVFHKWAIRTKSFVPIARTKFVQSIGTLGIQLCGYKLGVLALIVGHTVGQGIGATGLALPALKKDVFKNCSINEIHKIASRYRQFPIYSTWTALFNTGSLQLAPIIFIALYGPNIAGFYGLTLRILTLPMNLIGNAVGNVFLSSAPGARRKGELNQLVKKLHAKLSMVASLPLVVLMFFGPALFSFIFGDEWRKAGQYAQWMAPWIYLQFQWSPLSMLASVLELQKAALISQLMTFLSRFGTLVGCHFFGISPDGAIFAFALVSAVAYLLCMAWFFNKANIKIAHIFFTEIKHISICLLLVFPIWTAIKVIL